ncbi:MAG: presenilin family intramembrane aspartyl protease, partial [Candidatus Micrarchaeia archaeon]
MKMILIFMIAQLMALAVGVILIDNTSKIQAYQSLNIVPAAPDELSNVVYILGMVLLAALFILVVLLFPVKDVIIRVLEFSATVAASTIILFVLLSFIKVPAADLIAFFISIALYLTRFFFSGARLPLALMASAGVAVVIGFSLDPFPMMVLVIGLAIYDIIAVWWTGHMITFAKQFI